MFRVLQHTLLRLVSTALIFQFGGLADAKSTHNPSGTSRGVGSLKPAENQVEGKATPDSKPKSGSPASTIQSIAPEWRPYLLDQLRQIEDRKRINDAKRQSVKALFDSIESFRTGNGWKTDFDVETLIRVIQRTRARLISEKTKMLTEIDGSTPLQQFRLRSAIESVDREGGPLAGLVLDLRTAAPGLQSSKELADWSNSISAYLKDLDSLSANQASEILKLRELVAIEDRREFEAREKETERRAEEEKRRQAQEEDRFRKEQGPNQNQGARDYPISYLGEWACGKQSRSKCNGRARSALLSLRIRDGRLAGSYQVIDDKGHRRDYVLVETAPPRPSSPVFRWTLDKNRAGSLEVEKSADSVEVRFIPKGLDSWSASRRLARAASSR